MEQESVRLNKALADAGICSRRKADELIFSGKVKVNGTINDSPATRINIHTDTVTCLGKEVVFAPSKQHCCLLLHKPQEVVSTTTDPENRETVLDYVPAAWQSRRLYPVGRLDYFSEGLILLSDDGELTHRLTHPKWNLPRIYHVRVRMPYEEYDLDKAMGYMENGMTLEEGEILAPIKVKILKDFEKDDFDQRNFSHDQYDDMYQGHDRDRRGVLLEMVLHQGLNRQIRRMCRDLELTILRLKRVAHGPIKLGELPIGKVRELSSTEITSLKKACGLEE